VCVLVIDCYIDTNSLGTILAAISCVVVDEILNADSLPTNMH
jgi:hypothetical protein